jgi:long-subunit fatty acid transport protein
MCRCRAATWKWIQVLFSLAVLLCLHPAGRTFGALLTVDIPSSPNPVGSGARALGMGGAFIAVADDATAASWNPGGLIQLERPEISAVGAWVHRTDDISFGIDPGAGGEQDVNFANLNYLSAAYPFKLFNHNMIVSVNYQHLYDFNREWNFRLSDGISTSTIDHQQTGGLYAYGLAYGLQILPEFSLGFTLNIWEDGIYRNGWESTVASKTLINHTVFESFRDDRFSFSGFNANLGFLWSATDKLTLGGVFKTPFTADLEHETTASKSIHPKNAPTSSGSVVGTFSESEELDMPMSYGLGAAYRFSDRFTASADVYLTHWGDFVLTDSKGHKTSPVSGKASDESDIGPTVQVRTGGEYLFIRPKYVVPVRCGIFYDPAPAEDGADPFYGFSVGTGIGYGRFVFDIAYQYRFGFDVGKSILQPLKFSQDLNEHTIYTSLIVHF